MFMKAASCFFFFLSVFIFFKQKKVSIEQAEQMV